MPHPPLFSGLCKAGEAYSLTSTCFKAFFLEAYSAAKSTGFPKEEEKLLGAQQPAETVVWAVEEGVAVLLLI